METPATLFLLVNYFNDEDVIRFINVQLENQVNKNWMAIVTDNGSSDPSKLKDKIRANKNADYINANGNSGYFNGAAIGLDYFIKKYNSFPEFIIVSNADLEFKNAEFLKALHALKYNCDIIGPSIHLPDSNFDLNPFSEKRISKKSIAFLQNIFSIYSLYVVYQLLSLMKRRIGKNRNKVSGDNPQIVYAVHGSCMIFKKSFFEKGGKLHYPSFLYGEELFVAEQCRLLGLQTIYEPSLEVIHFEHSTTGTIKKPGQIRMMRKSLGYIIDTYFHD